MDFQIFLPLYKVEEQPDGSCVVFTRGTQQVRDFAGEVMDYDSTVPLIKQWSEDTFARSNGLSYGNIRSMHSNIAAGKLTQPPLYSDSEKAVDLMIHVIDPVEAKKCKLGVYTGASMGGKYIKRWIDPALQAMRYTGQPEEFSLVDAPAVPTATFKFVKADQTEELRKFTPVTDPTTQDLSQNATEEPLTEPALGVVNPTPDAPTSSGIPAVPGTDRIRIGEIPIVNGELLSPKAPDVKVIATSPQGIPAGEILSKIEDLVARYEAAVGLAEAMQKASADEKAATETKLKALGSRIGIARRDGEPLTPPKGYPTDPNEYGDPANYGYPCDTEARCNSAVSRFNGGAGKSSYSAKEWNILGRRIAQKSGTQVGAKYQYSPKDKQVTRIEASKSMPVPVKKDAMGDVMGGLRSVAQSALEDVSNPDAVMSALQQILAAIDVATDASSLPTPSSTPSGATSLEEAVPPMASTPTGGSAEYKTMMTKFEQMQEQNTRLMAAIEKLLTPATPEPPVQKSLTLGDLNAQVVPPTIGDTPLEKALMNAAARYRDGIGEDAMRVVAEASAGHFIAAQNTAMDLVHKSLAARGGRFSSANYVIPGRDQ